MSESSASDKPPIMGHNLIGFRPLRPEMGNLRNKWERAVEYIKGLTAPGCSAELLEGGVRGLQGRSEGMIGDESRTERGCFNIGESSE